MIWERRSRLMVQTPTKSIALDEFLQRPETKPASDYIDATDHPKTHAPGPTQPDSGRTGHRHQCSDESESDCLGVFPELRCTFGGRSIVPDVAVFQWERLPVNEGDLYTSRTIAPSFPNPFSRWEKRSRIEAPRPPGEGFGERGNGLVHQVCNYPTKTAASPTPSMPRA
jgi:hypothetical protein